jgi:hypothetical protein
MQHLTSGRIAAALISLFLVLAGLAVHHAQADTGDALAAWSESKRSLVFRVDGTGNVLPTTSGTCDLGATAMRFRDAYFAGSVYANDAVRCQTAGKGLELKEGTNAVMGTATLASGWASVPTTAVGASSRIFVSGQSTTGACYVKSRVDGTSFAIYSTDSNDAGTAAWMIVQPAP